MPMLFAAHKSTNWYMSTGYGQMFSMKKTLQSNANPGYAQLHSPRLFEVDFMHNGGFGFVYMAGSTSDGYMLYDSSMSIGPPNIADYKFKGYFVAYEKALNSGVTARFLLGGSNQSFNGQAENGHLATGLNLNYHFDFTKTFCAFVEGGYLKQKEFVYNITTKLNASAPYIKIGISKALR